MVRKPTGRTGSSAPLVDNQLAHELSYPNYSIKLNTSVELVPVDARKGKP